ncbi:hypothetical protein GIB67_039965 [Kingdonia uniflora]|uniref:Uncharacterized protein n=1 Tax=Kingdonia uniflora TaxID=39325 RepID=A0A7J7P4E8_9MAGN|nr:hypothetical protein GIB67_039965 [Kingdonia uniflora]
MEKKIESLARITAILKDIIQNKDRIIARLQRPYSLDCFPVEVEYHKQFLELLLKAKSDYVALTLSVADFQWSQNFRESPTIWEECSGLSPLPWHHAFVCEGEIFVPCRLAPVASGAASVKLLKYKVGGARISVQITYGVEVELENNPYYPSLMVFMYYRDYMKQKVQSLDT